MNIGSVSVKNPVFVNILMISILGLGFLSFQQMPREEFSEVPFYWVTIAVPFPGAGAEDVEKLVTIPVEDELRGLDSLDEIQSVSARGISTVQVRFSSGIDQDRFDRLYQEVITRFSRVILPEGTLKETIDALSSNDFNPVIEVVISGDIDYQTLINISERTADKLKKIREVSDVLIIGASEKVISVIPDQAVIKNLGISLNDIASSIAESNMNIPAGIINNENNEYIVRTDGERKNAFNLENIIVNSRVSNKGAVYLRDISELREEYKKRRNYSRYNGEKSVTLRVTKVPKGNSVQIVNRVKSIINTEEASVSDAVSFNFLIDSTVKINSSLDVLRNNAVLGLVLLFLILSFFLGIRNSVMTALGIPVTFAITFIILNLTGRTFNSNTLFALVLVLGMVVDHSIVITENCHRLREGGLSVKEAAVKGTNQVVLPVIAASATTIAAFLPLMILPGTIGRFLRVIPLTVAVALTASTFEALLFLPSHYAEWPGRNRKSREEKHMKKLKKIYSIILEKTYDHKIKTFLFFIIIISALFSLTGSLKKDLFSAEDYSVFYIDIELPPGSSLERTDRLVKKYEDILIPMAGKGEIKSVSSFIGFLSTDRSISENGNTAQILVELREKNEGRKRTVTEIMGEAENMTKSIAGADKVFFRKAVNGPPVDPPLVIRIFSDNLDGIRETASFIHEQLSGYPEMLNIENDLTGGTPEIRIIVNEEIASMYGLNVSSIGRYVKSVVDGVKADSILLDNNPVDIIVKYDNGDSLKSDQIEQLMVPSSGNLHIPFSAVASLVYDDSLNIIKRIDGSRVATVSAESYDKEKVKEISSEIISRTKDSYLLKYPDLQLKGEGEFAEFNNLIIKILQIFLVGIFLVYMILGTQFHSYTQPFLILLSVPLAFSGIILYLLISDTPFSTTVLYGGVALAGIAVNDSIIMISFINELRQKGYKIREAVIESALSRFRPIVLTSVTTIAGLLPTALGLGGSSVIWQPMANTIIFGLLFSTIGALVFVPAVYPVFYERGKIKKF